MKERRPLDFRRRAEGLGQEANPALSVIVTSGYTPERSRAETLRARGIVYLSKPYDIAELAKTVRACLGLAASRAPGG